MELDQSIIINSDFLLFKVCNKVLWAVELTGFRVISEETPKLFKEIVNNVEMKIIYLQHGKEISNLQI